MANSTYYENRIVSALAAADPKMDTSIGTPIRKIISAVAVELSDYDSQRTSTTSLYSLNSVSGVELEFLVGMFGFARQTATSARGTVIVKRDNPDSLLRIPAGTAFAKPATATEDAVSFQSTSYAEMPEGVLSVSIPVVATVSGVQGNVAANTIISGGDYGQYVSITNPEPTVGGNNAESDDELRTRFLLTVFRNEAGTADQILGLAYADSNVTRAMVIGQESRYSETTNVQKFDSPQNWNGLDNVEYYSMVSADRVSALVAEQYLDRNRVWVRNAETRSLINYGAFEPAYQNDVLVGVKYNGDEVSQVFVASNTTMAVSLDYTPILTGSVSAVVDGTSLTVSMSGNTCTLTGIPQASVENHSNIVVTYLQCVVNENDFVTIEFDYLSKYNRGGSNDVDVYIDGLDYQTASDIQYANANQKITAGNQADWLLDDNSMPPVGSWYLIPAQQPVIAIGENLSTGTSLLLTKDEMYKLAHDVTVNQGSRCAQDIVVLLGNEVEGDFVMTDSEGNEITLKDGQPMYVPYTYNRDVASAQNLILNQSPVTMDVEVHAAARAYFKFYLDVMYTVYQRDSIRQQVISGVVGWAANQGFGAIVQFSDIETVGANIGGVDNILVTRVERVTADGSTVLQTYTGDFYILPNELIEVSDVSITDKVQSNWGA